jgi:CDP-glucose 4,6-dehydratase
MDISLGKGLHKLNGPILITGHTGFKGAWMTLLLEKLGIEIVGLSLPDTPESLYNRLGRAGRLHEFFGDIRNLSVVQHAFDEFKPAAVIHMAAQPLVLESFNTPIETFNTNVMGTVHVLDTAIRSESVKGIVSVTTDKVYRNDESKKRFIESDPLAGKDPYSASKVGSESAILAWQQISKSLNGTPISSVRAGNVIGGGDWAEKRLMPDLIRGFIDNKDILIRNPKSTRPWQHALDPLVGYIKVLEEQLQSGRDSSYNFGPIENSLEVRAVAELASTVWGERSNVCIYSEEPNWNKESLTLDLNSEKAIQNLNWAPAWNQEKAIIATVEWWKKIVNEGVPENIACDDDLEFLIKRNSVE